MTGLNGVVDSPNARTATSRGVRWEYAFTFSPGAGVSFNKFVPLDLADPSNDYSGAWFWRSGARALTFGAGDTESGYPSHNYNNNVHVGGRFPPLLRSTERDVAATIATRDNAAGVFTQSGLFLVEWSLSARGGTADAIASEVSIEVLPTIERRWDAGNGIYAVVFSDSDTQVSTVGGQVFRAWRGQTRIWARVEVQAATLDAPFVDAAVTLTRLGD